MQQVLAKMQESVSSHQETDKDEEAETVTNISDGSASVVTGTEKLNENTRVDTTPSIDESLDKQINYESSQENLNARTSSSMYNLPRNF